MKPKEAKKMQNLISSHFDKVFRMGSYGTQGRRGQSVKNAELVEFHTAGTNNLPARNFFDKFEDQEFIDKNIKQVAEAFRLQKGDTRDKLLINGHTALIRQALDETDEPALKGSTIARKRAKGSKTPTKLLQDTGRMKNSLIAIEVKE